MRTVKQEIEAMVRALPEDASYADAQHRLYLLEKIRKSQESLAENGGLSQAEVALRLQKWRVI